MPEAAQDSGAAPALEYASAIANRESGRAGRRALAGAAVLAGVAAVAGAALQALDDGGVRLGVSRHWIIGLFVAGAAAVLAVGALLGRRAGSPVWKTVLAAGLVFGAWLAALSLFDASPLRGTVGYIYGNETQTQLAFNGFAMRLFLCWAATLMVGGASLLLARGREQVAWIGVALVLGLGSALAWAGSRMGGTWAWVRPGKWVKLMSMVLLVMMAVALVRLLVGAMRARGERGREARLERGEGGRVAGGVEVAGGVV